MQNDDTPRERRSVSRPITACLQRASAKEDEPSTLFLDPRPAADNPQREAARGMDRIGVDLASARLWRGLVAVVALLLASACAAPAGSSRGGAPTYPGFDTSLYPGAETLRVWQAESPYQWIGYYLPAPCHRERSWVGRRTEIERMGWGIAILYVGQQAFEGSVPPDSTAGTPIICSRTLLTDEQGRIDARDAADGAAREGFPRGSVIYLDVENMLVIPESMRAYYSAWQREILRDGRYVPGTYAHQANAVALLPLAEAAYREVGRTGTPPFWVAGGRNFGLDRPAWAIGLPFVRVWQGGLDVQRTWGGRTLLVDENVATSRSPSAPIGP